METYFCGLSLEETRHLIQMKRLPFRPVAGSVPPACELRLSEDRGYWQRAMEAQDDRASLWDYSCAVLVELSLDRFVVDLMGDPAHARASAPVREMLQALGRGDALALVGAGETGVVVLDEVAECEPAEGARDGMTQRFVIRYRLDVDDPLAERFHAAVRSVTIVGGLVGTAEALREIRAQTP